MSGLRHVLRLEVQARLRFEDFNITPPNIAGFVSVEDDVTLQVQVVAELV